MTQEQLQEIVSQKYPKFEQISLANDVTYKVPVEEARPFFSWLKEDSRLQFDNLMCLTAVDEQDHIDVVYHLSSYSQRHRIGVKISVENEHPEVPTVTTLWPGANWHEREVFDLYGVVFQGHPDLRRILLADDWEGHPMRKNYQHWNLTPLPDQTTEVTKDYSDQPVQMK